MTTPLWPGSGLKFEPNRYGRKSRWKQNVVAIIAIVLMFAAMTVFTLAITLLFDLDFQWKYVFGVWLIWIVLEKVVLPSSRMGG